LKVVISPGQTV